MSLLCRLCDITASLREIRHFSHSLPFSSPVRHPLNIFFTSPPPSRGAKYCVQSVCMSVSPLSVCLTLCISARLSQQLEAPLSQRTARRAMLALTCYVLRRMKVRKVSNCKSDLQGHSRTLEMVPIKI